MSTLDEMVTAPLLLLQDKACKHPLLAVCLQWLMGTKYVDSPTLPAPMATNGVSVLVNTAEAECMGHEVMSMVMAHEACHGIFEHVPSMKSFGPSYDDIKKQGVSQQECNIAMDIVINGMLEHEFGKRIEWVGKDGQPFRPIYIDTKTPEGKYVVTAEGRKSFSLDTCDFYWVLRHLDRKALQGKGGHGAQLGNDVIADGDATTEAQAQRNATRAIAQAQAMAKYQQWGDVPGWMQRFFQNLNEPKQDWRKELYEMHQSVRPVETSFRRLKTPYVFYGAGAPTMSVPGLGEVVFANDTSGSMTDEIMGIGISELRAIWQTLRPEKIHVLHVDAQVGHAETLDPDDFFEVHPKGGGGTAFEPAFKWVEENGVEPSCLIYFTDLYGSFPSEAPPYPVIWLASPGADSRDPPFGRCIRMEA